MQKIINEHKQAFIQTKNLSDFHINNLNKIVPSCFRQYGLDSVTVNYNFLDQAGNLTPGSVEYDVSFKGIPTYTKQDKETCIEVIKTAIKTIFFSETEVSIKVKGKIWN
jgi:hypothetical protein